MAVWSQMQQISLTWLARWGSRNAHQQMLTSSGPSPEPGGSFRTVCSTVGSLAVGALHTVI